MRVADDPLEQQLELDALADQQLELQPPPIQLRREGAKGFKLYAPPDVDDEEAEIEAELAAEELQHIGALPRFFARMNELVLFLTQQWLRLVEDNGSTNRSRWPMNLFCVTLRRTHYVRS